MRNHRMKYVIVFLSFVFAIALMPTHKVVADTVASGKCGDNVNWNLDDNGTLTISGSGDMQDYRGTNDDHSPWYSFREKITNIAFSGNITSIGENAFCGCNVTKIEIPASVKKIRHYALGGCDNLTYITFAGNTPVSIESSAFCFCSKLNTVLLPDNSEVVVAKNILDSCSSLRKVVVNRDAQIKLNNDANKWIRYYYSVTYTSDGHGTISGETRVYDGLWKFQITHDDKYVLDKVTLNYGDYTRELSPDQTGYYHLSNLSSDITISATFKPGFKVKVNEVSDGRVVVSRTEAGVGDEVTVSVYPNKGYKLNEIKVNGEVISGTSFTMPDADVTVDVSFSKIDYNIKYVRVWKAENTSEYNHPYDDSVVSVKYANYGDEITISLSQYIGYEIESIRVWCSKQESDICEVYSGNSFLMPDDDISILVKIKKIPYSVSVTDSINGTAQVSKTTANYGDTISIISTPDIGYVVDTIKVNGTTITGTSFTMGAENTIVEVTFKKGEYTITVSPSTGGSAVVSPSKANYGDLITIVTNAEAGYELGTIKVNGKAITGTTFTMDAKDTIVVVTFKKLVYTITVSETINGSARVNKTTASIGDKITVTTTPASGYELDAIKVNGTAITGMTFTMDAGNTTVVVTFKKSVYTVTVSGTTNGSAKVDKTSASIGDKITVTTTPASGYELDAIKINGTAITGTTFTMDAGNTTVVVTFKKSVYTVTVSGTTNGSAKVDKTSASIGDKITVTATPASGYELDKIKVNGSAITGTTFTMGAGNTTVDVTFIKHDLTAKVATAPTCTEDGHEAYYECSRCHKLFSDADGKNEIEKPVAISKLGHKLTLVDAKEPTKDAPGNIKHYKCDRCEKLFGDADGKMEISSDSVVIEKLKHNLTAISAKAATCTEDGHTAYYKCEDSDCGCGKVYNHKYGRDKDEISINDTVKPTLGHNSEEVAGKDPTCTEDGYEKYYKCSRCHKLFSDADGKNEIEKPVAISKLGHDMKHVEAKKPTHDDDGHREYYHCDRCGKNFADSEGSNPLTDAEIVVPHIGAAVLDEEITEGDFIYKVTNPRTDGTGTVMIIGVANETEAVVIPATVELKLDTYKVTRIGTKAFYNNKTIKTLSIGANVTVIDSYAFAGCSNLTKVSGGTRVQTIGSYVFANCSKLSSFTITSSTLKKIGYYAFNKDKKLKTIYIKNTTKLTKSGVKKSLKGSSVKTVKVKKSKVKKYKKFFTKKNAGRKVKVKK